jgi:predicted oxidoreductase (fatty acid repression mutant protein)
MKNEIRQAIVNRRTIYGIGRGSGVSQETILDIVRTATDYVPTAFNSQSSHAVILMGKAHERLWEIVAEALKKVVPGGVLSDKTKAKLDGFSAGEGTILFFDDSAKTAMLEKAFPPYAENMVPWAEQSVGALQYLVWVLLEDEGLGASFQHYNPLIDDAVKAEWKIPASYRLRTELVFGKKLKDADPRPHLPIDQRVQIFDK